MQQSSLRKEWINEWNTIQSKISDLTTLVELAEESAEESYVKEMDSDIGIIQNLMSELEFRNMLSGEDDNKNAILTIHSGAGGTEAQDWAEMLLRMYLRWSEKRGFKTFLLDQLEGDGAGIKSATIEIQGEIGRASCRERVFVHV
jgi:peptide chain release factor 2